MKIYKKARKVLEHFESDLGYNKSNDEEKKTETLSTLKNCFDVLSSKGKIKLNADKKYDLNELFVDGFDEEQIWQQLELRNGYLTSYVPTITNFLMKENDIQFPCLREKVETPPEVVTDEKLEKEKDHLNGDVSDGADVISGDEENEIDEDGGMSDSSEMSNASEKSSVLPKSKEKGKKTTRKKDSLVDDDFFSINEMEKFLDDAEKEEVEDDGIDYFEDIPSDHESKNAKFDDFFRDPGMEYEDENQADYYEDEDMDEEEELDEKVGSKKKVRFSTGRDEESSYDELDEEGLGESKKNVKFSLTGDSDESSEDEKTTFEMREAKLRKKIEKMEESYLEPKPWQYKGEVKVSERPVNSLLEEVVDVDMSVRPPPVFTESVSQTLEQLIITRIKDSAYDDVERKIKPVHVPHELKKDLVLNQEKSKYSLAEVYEQEYLKRKPNAESAEDSSKPDPEKEKILKAMKSVFHKLDILSNFHYIPKPASADIEIVNNMPAITMEEVTPAAVSDAALLAPQEVGDAAKKKLLGKDERTKTDKKRERRKKKAFLSHKFKKAKNTENAKISQVLKSRKVDLIKQNEDTHVKSSTAFFTKLQENKDVGKNVKIKKKHSKA